MTTGNSTTGLDDRAYISRKSFIGNSTAIQISGTSIIVFAAGGHCKY
jgi:hypothetical protein